MNPSWPLILRGIALVLTLAAAVNLASRQREDAAFFAVRLKPLRIASELAPPPMALSAGHPSNPTVAADAASTDPIPPAPLRGRGYDDPGFCRALYERDSEFGAWTQWNTVTGHPHPSVRGLAMIDALGVLAPMSTGVGNATEAVNEREHSRFGSIEANAGCAHYPYTTGVSLEHIVATAVQSEWGERDVGCVAMTFEETKSFILTAWPVVIEHNLSIVIVSAWGDGSAPWEMLKCDLEWSAVASIATFLRSPNLLHWYTQNWDLAPSPHKRRGYYSSGGVNAHDKCSDGIPLDSWPAHDVPFCAPNDVDILRKVSPLPIGMDFWRLPWPRSAKNVTRNAARTNTCPLRTMMHTLGAAKRASPPFAEKTLKVLIAFGEHRNTRITDYAVLSALGETLVTDVPRTIGKVPPADLWTMTTQHAFVAAPASHGQDCYREWEALALGTVPVSRRASTRLHGNAPLSTLP